MAKATLTKIRKAVKDAVFNPRKPGPMKIIADINDPDYCCKRAAEILMQQDIKINDDDLKQVISLVALARVQNGAKEDT